ncbi:MAG: hypothetical protein PHN38_02755 [Sulfurospirillaceae bacterium]|nr:hypothetical protein [Sulfurospirillaceae bacterium]MDD3462123.1 hypothetical protein [Sulfurospirillaceae bacterium]
MKKFFMLAIATVATLVFLGCGVAQVYNVNGNAINANKQATLEDVQKAITRAGGGLGWIMKKVSENEMQGTLMLRKHVAVVSIKHTTQDYSINYVSSTNLDYSPTENTIHSNYNGWIQNLNKAIQVQLGLL